MKREIFFAVFATVAALSFVHPTAADSINLESISNATIQNGEGASRILVGLGSLTDLVGKSVGNASLTIPLSGTAVEKSLEVRAYPILSPWSAGAVSWNGGWETAGGDIDPELYTRADIDFSHGPAQARIDVSLLLTELADGLEMYGILLTVPPFEAEGFSSEEMSLLGSASNSTIDVSYRGRVGSAISDHVNLGQ